MSGEPALKSEPNVGNGDTARTVIKGNASKYVKLNVGGSLHYTTIGTLTKHDNMLRAMFSGRMEVLTDSEGWILIDRCGKHFGTILNFLRDGSVALPDNRREIAEILAEAKYYLVQDLVTICEAALKKKQEEMDPICKVPLITSSKEEQLLISSTSKPVVKLSCNRHNNKYSYTSHSDDNLLRNLELFDKLSLRFNGRVLFVKDVIGSNEICCWSFYGHGSKIAEVCCTSIVYGTDKKHTKVEFPEARIYEETLNVLLYENRDKGPDAELMQATRGHTVGATVAGYHSDDEEERERIERGVDRLRRK
ncbi:BTB/POZ domain-containing adapter for CUL3-mediated RhoA degradation protein 3 [Lingula anatina]|uniref:BTB/POZ domain-containing adapter for CUL3-mediated RhoA degradation protein 3 n=1 Tax=Lingula anatina TaxID=7574 RepID=A0A1S3KER6_LINAN|nr:BTB/POZ domain-containing adapter for CUL3-mediated RhoA degradation protein 3-like [Lingula anatina]XP_013420736.1 BTB/POZ domain-containing adapter for CUL3-mediated RhoA degradation protein 3 [Lingula anatina]|eukprot:XP_013420735.1 BTB/POZ domain-containing adapter for CUL3-mediated RhoA degradation protein 3-like [Lingula anatina]